MFKKRGRVYRLKRWMIPFEGFESFQSFQFYFSQSIVGFSAFYRDYFALVILIFQVILQFILLQKIFILRNNGEENNESLDLVENIERKKNTAFNWVGFLMVNDNIYISLLTINMCRCCCVALIYNYSLRVQRRALQKMATPLSDGSWKDKNIARGLQYLCSL